MNTKLVIATLVTLAISGSAIDPRQFGDGSPSAAATSFRAAASSTVSSDYASITSAAAVSASASSAAALGTETPTGTDTLEAVLPVSYTTTGKIFPPSPIANGVVVPQDFSVNCINCSITGDISLAGGGKFGDIPSFTVDTPPDLLVIHPEFDFIQKWVAASVDNLTAHFEFGLN
ncbi:hypothetical protein OEA41_009960 [Lepraria neglecta]|uniref:Uncharacterized protein n=1 Tax=Lepraria neglecta TaxID=209136 RepID=A0AAD9YVM2_9LECA|nr:hypothetical protein OEA41_009960 [Lepraria neglecta]